MAGLISTLPFLITTDKGIMATKIFIVEQVALNQISSRNDNLAHIKDGLDGRKT